MRGLPPPSLADSSAAAQIYALFKQATTGDVSGGQPWAVQMEKRAKWDAHNEVKGERDPENPANRCCVFASGGAYARLP